MDYQRQSNGLVTFLEHWWLLVIAVLALAASQALTFFTRLTGTAWVWCYAMGLVVAAVGVALIFYAKLPLYAQRRFFTFGSRRIAGEQAGVLSLGLSLRSLRCRIAFVSAIVETMKRSRNKPDASKPAVASRVQSNRHWGSGSL